MSESTRERAEFTLPPDNVQERQESRSDVRRQELQPLHECQLGRAIERHQGVKTLISGTIAGTLVLTASVSLGWLTRTADAQSRREATWSRRTPWGDPE